MKSRYKKPRIASSKKACICAETGKKITKFETVLIDPTNGIKIYCSDSEEYKKFVKR